MLFQLHTVETELSQLRSAVGQYESLTTEYKNQLEKYRKENEELADRLRSNERETHRKLQQSISEVEDVSYIPVLKIFKLIPWETTLFRVIWSAIYSKIFFHGHHCYHYILHDFYFLKNFIAASV